ncbi:MAG: hypothetical protein WBV06_01330 [Acidimicrobiia bacterium]
MNKRGIETLRTHRVSAFMAGAAMVVVVILGTILVQRTGGTSHAIPTTTIVSTTTNAPPVPPVVDCGDLVDTEWVSLQELSGGDAPGGGTALIHWAITFQSANQASWRSSDTVQLVGYACTDGRLTTSPEWLGVDAQFVAGTAGEVLLEWDGDLYEQSETGSGRAENGVIVGDFEGWEDFSVVDALNSLLSSNAIVEATAVEIGRCCENPVLRVEDVEAVKAREDWQATDELHSQEYQSLYTSLQPGDRLTTITRGDLTELVFDTDGQLLHPVPQGMADALELVMRRETTNNPLEAVRQMWNRYNNRLWYTGPESLADVYLQGERGYEDVTCSATDLGGDAEDLLGDLAPVALPDAVIEARDELIRAAIDCDYDRLIDLIGTDEPDDSFWWGANGDVSNLQTADRDGALRMLVIALSATEPAVVSSTDGSGNPLTYYEWPAAAQVEDWAQLEDEQRRLLGLLNGLSPQQLEDAWNVFGGYGLFRVGIAEDGTWLFALSGD